MGQKIKCRHCKAWIIHVPLIGWRHERTDQLWCANGRTQAEP